MWGAGGCIFDQKANANYGMMSAIFSISGSGITGVMLRRECATILTEHSCNRLALPTVVDGFFWIWRPQYRLQHIIILSIEPKKWYP